MTSTIKVDNIQKTSDGSNIIKKCGSTITIGSSGQTVAVACGATTSGMGRTGTVDWCTTVKTSPLTAASGNGYFINTTSGGVTVTLPSSPSAGDIVAFKDYANTFDCNALTICRGGSKINGVCANAALNTESQSVTLIYVDGTKGWQDIHDSTSDVTGSEFIVATGGTITTCGNFKIHTFTGDGCFAVTAAPNPANAKVSYVTVAGGGGGGGDYGNGAAGAGGGAGGFREGKLSTDPYSASPLAGTPCSSLPVSVQTYPIAVGAGGPAGNAPPSPDQSGLPGAVSTFSSITSTGGGGGGEGYRPTTANGKPGGSGGGAGSSNAYSSTVGSGNTPPVSPPQGNNGGNDYATPPVFNAGGGGGASAAGTTASAPAAGPGGNGVTSSITGAAVTRGGGGGGGATSGPNGSGGSGGGGAGVKYPTTTAVAGTPNTGGGGGGYAHASGTSGSGGAGGSGIVIIRYKFQ
tara:strand:+ start:930 stop:2318 length:1389 start_codon:yes stop_codon:yes gene_type:complete